MLSKDKIKNLLSHPNSLTLCRIAIIPVIVILMLFPNRFFTFIAALLFSAAAITDYLDGYFARRRGLVTDFGKIMDPVADKLLASSAFIMLSSLGWIPGWMVCIIIGREIAVTGLRNFAVESREDIAASSLGKYKTGFQIAAIIPLLFHYPYFGLNFHAIGTLFLWAALVLTVWSGVDYFIKFKRHLKI
ncbi:MAG: CDP-diacylglycerol--glycerol-3-phosphate 3-phosphatidyltransferase [Desulfobacteraceae bacterium]|uniref:CDP-diacylglycerol--glycerol-3-phosphate 3-phosphatidyltransferase n=1 Tax=Candidatus Desulfaltia bathyphila TaxID=2841697 RepID=A0A8J6N8Q7_9BACT|nr:CDP-diacylglycerol--glycerol-3-phosphate 3-phosphatidyltransferase [Candidatus Desulfaltia bathyphila]MBL7194775.1 CDP-diacylglycerol--glycerol-3-phosphate 3-phosphatidyltransferase [Desulfobacterales bacterium]